MISRSWNRIIFFFKNGKTKKGNTIPITKKRKKREVKSFGTKIWSHPSSHRHRNPQSPIRRDCVVHEIKITALSTVKHPVKTEIDSLASKSPFREVYYEKRNENCDRLHRSFDYEVLTEKVELNIRYFLLLNLSLSGALELNDFVSSYNWRRISFCWLIFNDVYKSVSF